MNEIEATVLNPKSNLYNLLGELANQPQFLAEADVNVEKEDAVDKIHRMILAAMINVIPQFSFKKSLSALDIDIYLRQYPRAYKFWKDQHGARYLTGAIESTKGKNPQDDYEAVKKYRYLRIYMNHGMDITGVFNYRSKNIDVAKAKLANLKVSDIVDHFSTKTDKIKKSWQDSNNDIQSFEIGDGIIDHIKKLTQSSMFGYPFQNGFYNQLFGGMRKDKYMIRSTVTGGGKTRQALKDFCNVAFRKYFDPYKRNSQGKMGDWVDTGSSYPALFISTELNKAELQNIVLAYLTGIDSKKITFGQFNDAQKKLLNEAVRVIKDAHFYFEYVEDFNSNDIENIVDKYARRYGVKYVDFDYIQESPRLMQELRQSFGNGLRSDQALVFLSKELKKMAEKYHIFIMSATQVNGFYSLSDEKEKSRTEYTLRGGKSIADKVDYGIITSRFTKADKNAFSKNKELNDFKPNYAHHVYKNRSGEHNIVVWTVFNTGNLREKPLVVTDYNYNVIHDIKPLEIQYD